MYMCMYNMRSINLVSYVMMYLISGSCETNIVWSQPTVLGNQTNTKYEHKMCASMFLTARIVVTIRSFIVVMYRNLTTAIKGQLWCLRYTTYACVSLINYDCIPIVLLVFGWLKDDSSIPTILAAISAVNAKPSCLNHKTSAGVCYPLLVSTTGSASPVLGFSVLSHPVHCQHTPQQ